MEKCRSLINFLQKIIDICQNGFLQKLSIFFKFLQEGLDIFKFSVENFYIFDFFSIRKKYRYF